MDMKGGKPRGGGGGGVMNWAIGTDMYTLTCIKLMMNKNLLYKKINTIKFKNQKKNLKKPKLKKKKENSTDEPVCRAEIETQM